MLGVIAYLAVRFDVRFGLAATLSTFHDVLAVLGICWLLGKEFDLLIMTALLTLAGFSPTILWSSSTVSGENMAKHEGMHLFDLINLSINETLARPSSPAYL